VLKNKELLNMKRILNLRLGFVDLVLLMAFVLSASVLRADGPSLPPAPWEQLQVADGPSLPPAPWEQLRVPDGPSLPPAPWEQLQVAAA
jgi:hypothetical protein